MVDARKIYGDDPGLPDCTVNLIDALGAYIRVVEFDIDEPSPALIAHIAKCNELLKELKTWEIDPTLYGTIRPKMTP